MTLEEFVQKGNQIHNNFYDYIKVSFSNMKDIITIICPEHGEFDQKVSVHINDKCGCPKCGLLKRNHKSKEKFIEEANLSHNFQYDYSLVEYVDSHTKVKVICKKHGVFEQRPYAHLSKQGCPKCGIKNRKLSHKKTTEQFLLEAKQKWGDKYSYSCTEYKNKNTKIKYICPKHGIVEQLPSLHIRNGCQFCSGRGVSKYNLDLFLLKAAEVHGDIYDYSEINKVHNVQDRVTILCKTHGRFEQRVMNHLNGDGCPKCNGGVRLTDEEYKERALLVHGKKFNYGEYTNSHDKIRINCIKHNREFEQIAYVHLSSLVACPLCVAELTVSKDEILIRDFIKENYGGKVCLNDMEILGGKEIDIWLPELRLGFEYHGMYWHTESMVGKDYHLTKADLAEKAGIRLIQIYENEWLLKKDIVKSRIKNLLGVSERIYARKTKVVELNREEKDEFLNRTHIQGADKSSYYCGLLHDGRLVACMTFGTPRFRSDCDYELIRYSSELGYNIIGGASKLLSYFRSRNNGKIVSYADRRWSGGNLYYRLGFDLCGKASSGYGYYNIRTKQFENRQKFQKHKLVRMFGYDDRLTEYDIMKLNGYDRIWDAGQYRFILNSFLPQTSICIKDI